MSSTSDLPRAIAFDFEGFSSPSPSRKYVSIVRSRLEAWSPNRKETTEEVLEKLDTACARREKALFVKKAAAQKENRSNDVKRKEDEASVKLQADIEAKMVAALIRAEKKKKETALKGSKMGIPKSEAVRKKEVTVMQVKKEAINMRFSEVAARAEKIKASRIEKACRMANPGKKRCLAPSSEQRRDSDYRPISSRFEYPVPVALVFEGFTRSSGAKKVCVEVRSRLEAWSPARSRDRAEIKAKVDKAVARAEQKSKERAEKGNRMGMSRYEAVKKMESTVLEAKKDAINKRFSEVAARAEVIKATRMEKASRMAKSGNKNKCEDSIVEGSGPIAVLPLVSSMNNIVDTLPPAPSSVYKEQQVASSREASSRKAPEEQMIKSIIDEAPPPIPAVAEAASQADGCEWPPLSLHTGSGFKVTTLRRDSPTGSHVISVVTTIPEDFKERTVHH